MRDRILWVGRRVIRTRAIVFGVLVELVIICFANFIPLPSSIISVGILITLSAGLVGGFIAGTLTNGGWKARAMHGLVSGFIGGVAFGITLWFSMSLVIPRTDYSALWGINYILATNPIGIRQLPWLYTGNTLLVPLVLLSAILFAIEGYIAGGAAFGRSHSQNPPINSP